MKFNEVFHEYINCLDPKSTYLYLQTTLANSITGWDYFVNWSKARNNIRDLEIDLNMLSYLVGKDDIENEFRNLLIQRPSIVMCIPILIACRQKKFQILNSIKNGKLEHKSFSFIYNDSLSINEINDICDFASKSGVLNLFKNKVIKNVPDYVFGIEIGLDSNGRKNRGGTAMEMVVGDILQVIVAKHNFQLIPQADSAKIYHKWGVDLKVDKTNRRFDYALLTPLKLYLFETNFYNGGGSKLKSTAGEYKSVFDFLHSQDHGFIWITDGLGWRSAFKPLEEAFNHLDYIFNLQMAISLKHNGTVNLLEEILVQGL